MKGSVGIHKEDVTVQNQTPQCAKCPYQTSDRLCRIKDGKSPDFCPTGNMEELVEQSLQEYKDNKEICDFAKEAAVQETEGYSGRELGYDQVRASKTRIEEILEFAKKMNYNRIGMAFCMGLRKEAKIVERIFTSRGFEMVSAICKVGCIPKQEIGVGKEQQIVPDSAETMCNPVLQAMILNREKTDFNVLLGLCVGHDSLFFKYGEAPCTVLAVKDRLLSHNPLGALYTIDSYYRSLK